MSVLSKFLPIAALAAGALAAAAGLAPVGAAAKGAAETRNAAFASARDETIVLRIGKAHVVDLDREARDVLISDPKIVDSVMRTARQPVLFGMRIGQANVLFFDDGNREIRSLEVRVEYDTAILNQMIRNQFPDADARAESVLGEIILTGRADSSAESTAIQALATRFLQASRVSTEAADAGGDAALSVINRIKVINEEQIQLKVQVAEVSRDVLKQLGVDWNVALNSASISTLFQIQGGFPFLEILTPATVPVSIQPLSSFLQVLERYSLVRTLAEPTLSAVSGETASFLAGGEFPIPVSADDGDIAIEFKSFGVGLDFTPVVLGDGRISLQIATEVSELTEVGSVEVNGFDIPALSLRRASTTLEISSGGTMMLAGLIQQSTRRLSTGLPGLRSLPVIGSFFRSENTEIEDTELVILVTPYVVSQNSPDAFSTPNDDFAPASDLDVYLFGRLHEVYGAGDPQDPLIRQQAADLKAPIGFMME